MTGTDDDAERFRGDLSSGLLAVDQLAVVQRVGDEDALHGVPEHVRDVQDGVCPQAGRCQPSSMGPDIEYNSTHSRLAETLQSIDRTGDFCCLGRIEAPPPRMHVSSVGQIAFPVLRTQIRQLIDAAGQAPYGRGTETIVDTLVQDCWQIGAADVDLGGARWLATLNSIAEAAADGLGIPATAIDLQLYKLLIYEKGGFFKEHRDTERRVAWSARL